MKKVGKPVFFIVAILIVAITCLSFLGISTSYGDVVTTWIKGVKDIRFGIDVRGGVEVTFLPQEGVETTAEQVTEAESRIKQRLLAQNITDSEVYTDTEQARIIVRFPWQPDNPEFDPETVIEALSETARLTFREGAETDSDGNPTGVTAENVLLEGSDVAEAYPSMTANNQYCVALNFTDSGKEKLSEATTNLVGQTISVWIDNTMVSNITITEAITSGQVAIASSTFTMDQVTSLAERINNGALPFDVVTEGYRSIAPTLGSGTEDVLVLAGIIVFVAIVVLLIVFYRLPGVVAAIALLGQVGLMIASATGFFGDFSSFTLTLSGLAGMLLSFGFAVSANVLTAQRIKEELRAGKALDGAINTGCKRAFSAVIDSNVAMLIIAIIFMAAFGPSTNFFAKMLSFVFRWFGVSTAGALYSFGYTLFAGIIINIIISVLASRLMLKSISKFELFRKDWLYGGAKKND